MTIRYFQTALLGGLALLASCVVAPAPEAVYPAYGYAPAPYYGGYPWYSGPEIGIGLGVGRGWHGGGRGGGGRGGRR